MTDKPNSPISEAERRWLSGPTEKQKDERIRALEQQNATLLKERAQYDWAMKMVKKKMGIIYMSTSRRIYEVFLGY